MTRMLRIGEFSRLTGLSVRTLRFYDAVDVLRPAEVGIAALARAPSAQRRSSRCRGREGHSLQGPKREMPIPAEPGWLEISFPFRPVAPA